MFKETSSKKKHFQNDSRTIFSSIFNFVVIFRLKCSFKINFFILKIQTFQKRHCKSERFRILQIWFFFKSQLPTNILNLLNFKFRCLDKLNLVWKLFLSLVNTRKNQKNFLLIQGFQNLSVCFSCFFCKYPDHSHKCDDIEIQLCEKYWKFQRSFTKGKHLEQNNFLQDSNSLPWVDFLSSTLCNEKIGSEISSFYKENFVC